MNEINRNFSWSKEYSEGSFVGVFHENHVWDDEEYYKLENYLYEACERYAGQSSIPREVFWPAMRIYSYLSQSISCHFDPNDGFEIKHINQDQLYQRRERLQLVFEGFFKGEMPNKKYLGY
ncbi:Imm41 family immunity protein [Aeromonas diversa]|uniref:Imm41 family immunity protein n=1 Tax=Aeromonas diversa TaxID=502790 RepID=UPI0009DA8F56|nr:Imm41 family immunity protein [Aeromonas diversa]